MSKAKAKFGMVTSGDGFDTAIGWSRAICVDFAVFEFFPLVFMLVARDVNFEDDTDLNLLTLGCWHCGVDSLRRLFQAYVDVEKALLRKKIPVTSPRVSEPTISRGISAVAQRPVLRLSGSMMTRTKDGAVGSDGRTSLFRLGRMGPCVTTVSQGQPYQSKQDSTEQLGRQNRPWFVLQSPVRRVEAIQR